MQDCRQTQNCHQYASCDFDDEEGRFMCICKPGYIGNGDVCRTLQEENCLTLENCSPNAECVPSYNGDYECQCISGFTGNGYSCAKVYPDSPQCLFGVCFCASGFVFDGIACKAAESKLERIEAKPQCYGSACACPKGYNYNLITQTCDFTYIAIPAQGM